MQRRGNLVATTVPPSNPNPSANVSMALWCKSWLGFSKSHHLCRRKSFAGSPDDWPVRRWSWERKVVLLSSGLLHPPFLSYRPLAGVWMGGTVGVQGLPPLSASRVAWKCSRTCCGRRECKVLPKERGYLFLPSSPEAQQLVGSEVCFVVFF